MENMAIRFVRNKILVEKKQTKYIVRGCLKSTRMTQIKRIFTDFLNPLLLIIRQIKSVFICNIRVICVLKRLSRQPQYMKYLISNERYLTEVQTMLEFNINNQIK